MRTREIVCAFSICGLLTPRLQIQIHLAMFPHPRKFSNSRKSYNPLSRKKKKSENTKKTYPQIEENVHTVDTLPHLSPPFIPPCHPADLKRPRQSPAIPIPKRNAQPRSHRIPIPTLLPTILIRRRRPVPWRCPHHRRRPEPHPRLSIIHRRVQDLRWSSDPAGAEIVLA